MVMDGIHNAKRFGLLISRPLLLSFVSEYENGICFLTEYQVYWKIEENQRCIIAAGMEYNPEKQMEAQTHDHRCD